MSASDPHAGAGKVFLVGAGPGDPELRTRKGARLLASADTVVFDQLVGEGVLDLAPESAQRIYVGKEPGRHELPQPEINRVLIEHARAGRCVVRPKGGDPFVLGRGGEEIIDLAAAGVPFEVVPGVTAASAASAYSGVPLTHRGREFRPDLASCKLSARRGPGFAGQARADDQKPRRFEQYDEKTIVGSIAP